MLSSIRFPDPTLTFASRRSVSENDTCVPLRTGPVPFGTDGAAPAADTGSAARGLSNNHTFDDDRGDTCGADAVSFAAAGAADTAGGTASTDAASNADATPTAV
ncbi:hypothetical protein [Micromonospora sp. NPDC001898]|uniref:hypothetical protein n=1 Tax=Micromonospora sp. NPDC001898 TaxID=3364221 RepID=UPI003681D4B6